MKGYVVTTATLSGLFSAWHVYELVSGLRAPQSDSGFLIGVSLIIVLSAALSLWGWRVLKGVPRAEGSR